MNQFLDLKTPEDFLQFITPEWIAAQVHVNQDQINFIGFEDSFERISFMIYKARLGTKSFNFQKVPEARVTAHRLGRKPMTHEGLISDTLRDITIISDSELEPRVVPHDQRVTIISTVPQLNLCKDFKLIVAVSYVPEVNPTPSEIPFPFNQILNFQKSENPSEGVLFKYVNF